MNGFVLCTGRCGSYTVSVALRRMTNRTVRHESRIGFVEHRVDYPPDHIEVDNRLAWFLGSLERRFGDDAVYAHLTRDPELVAESYARRLGVGLASAFADGVLIHREGGRLAAMRLMVSTILDNIEAFLADKTRVADIPIEDPEAGFRRFWAMMGCEGDVDAAVADLRKVRNASR